MRYRNAFYFQHINDIGGVETMFYELAKKYKDWDITVFYKTGSQEQVNRLRKYIRVVRLKKGEKVKCDKAFFNYQLAIDSFDAREYWQILHADFKQQGIAPNVDDRLTGYIAVSQTVANSFFELTGEQAIVCYNPITITEEDIRPVLYLVSATRLTKEKGKGRMAALANALNEHKILFKWDIYTNDTEKLNIPNVQYLTPTLNIRPYIAKADAVVQLSDSEGWCYTINEAFCLGVPVIATPIPSIAEMDGKNVIYLDFDLSNMEEVIEKIKALITHKVKTKYQPKADIWNKLLVPGKSTYFEPDSMIEVKVAVHYWDIVLEEELYPGMQLVMHKERAQELMEKGLVKALN